MAYVAHGVVYGGTTLLAQETVVETYLCHTARGGKGTQLVVGEVSRVVAQGTC